MGLFNKIDQRAGVMGKMAETLGVDFAEKITQDPNMTATYREAVMRCSHCKHDGECTGWMAEHPHSDTTPDYCRNKDLLEQLAQS
ncbi:hypothetical protein SAMN06265173_10139 [Thalassovita litoralis]|jgi:hypothetical protein|uniref:DUF6455 domain-containing protein n=1 Tax=Thalassovita litoralis TaxID=1010611 RepID=A0A521AC07_9RHOB|nr:DUF6455 family protein [Thalassovita litoralis]SMO32318.1 hypothetical protein SAMN06265173_10139 [Thalassovita litoralis]